MLRFFGWGSANKTSRPDNLDDELNSNLTLTRTPSSRSAYRTPPSQISISAPIPRNCAATSLGGLDNPYIAESQANGSSSDLRQFRHPNTSLTRLGSATNQPAASSSTSLGRVPVSYKSPQPQYTPYHLPSPPLSDGGSDIGSPTTIATSMTDGPPPAVIRIETNARLPARKTLQPSPTRGSSPTVTPTTQQGFAAPLVPTPMRRTASSPPSSTSPCHGSPAEESSPSSSELAQTFPGGTTPSGNGANAAGKWNLKLHTTNPIYSQSTQSLPTSSSFGAPQFTGQGMYSDPSLAYSEANPDIIPYTYPYPPVKQLSPIAEQDYMSPDSLKRPTSLPGSNTASRVGSEQDMRGSGASQVGSLTQSVSPIGSQTSEITRPSPSCITSPFINRPLNRTASQGSSRTHVSTTESSFAGPRSTKSDSPPAPPVIPPLDLRPSFIGPHSGSMQPSPTGSGRIRSSKFSNPMPSIIGSTDGYEEDEYYGATDRESLHAESFVTATDDDDRPGHRRGNSARDIETVDKEFSPRSGPSGPAVPETASVRSGISRVMLPSASESFITRRWDRDAALAPGVTTFRAKKQWINVTPAFWAFWFGFLCPFLWLVGGWHFTHFGEQPPRLTYWEFYFTGFWKGLSCCGSRTGEGDEEMGQMKREGKQTAVEPPPLPRWVAEKQSSELGRARLNDPKRSLKGISFGYPFITRPMPPKPEDETVFKKMVKRMLEIMDKPNRIFDSLYGIRLREVRGRPESGRRMFDPWIQRCRYALCYAMLLLAIGLLTASAYLIVYNTRQL